MSHSSHAGVFLGLKVWLIARTMGYKKERRRRCLGLTRWLLKMLRLYWMNAGGDLLLGELWKTAKQRLNSKAVQVRETRALLN